MKKKKTSQFEVISVGTLEVLVPVKGEPILTTCILIHTTYIHLEIHSAIHHTGNNGNNGQNTRTAHSPPTTSHDQQFPVPALINNYHKSYSKFY